MINFQRPTGKKHTLDIGKPRMGANLDIVLLAVQHGFLHYQRIAGVETARNIGMVDER